MKLRKRAVIIISPYLVTVAATLAATLVATTALAGTDQAQDMHPKVEAALSWQMPNNECKQPKSKFKATAIIDNSGVKRSYDGDHYQEERQARKTKRWSKCVKEYKEQLVGELNNLKSSAQYGLTQPQATIILGKMSMIQSVLNSASGTAEPEL